MRLTAALLGLLLATAFGANAEVGYDLPASDATIAESAARYATFGSDRYLVVNGTVMRTKLGQTDLPARALIDRVERDWEVAHGRNYAAAEDFERAVGTQDIELEFRRPFRFDAAGWSMLGKIFGGEPDPSKPFLESFMMTGALGENAAGGSMLVAFESGDAWLGRRDCL